MIFEFPGWPAPSVPIEVCRRFADGGGPLFFGHIVCDSKSRRRAAFITGELAERVVLDESFETAELAGGALP
jgi:hypothetical protein